ncbi:hypothetical protein GPALN_003345 [Globodera pallida]|nr:hypothetical protein GPALN_003345 [Globodera pallida]
MSLPSGTVVTFYSIELLIDIVVLAVACLNLAVIGTTKLLHPNLKFILITQSVAVVFFVLVRSAMLLIKFISNDDLSTPSNLILQDLMSFDVFYRRMIGHALIIERFMATIIIKIGRYNRRKYVSQIEEASPNNYHIGQRYQVLENVKTAKQLFPTFLCFLLSNLSLVILCIIITTNVAKDEYRSLIYSFFFLIGTILAGAIEISVITHHPLLKRRVARIFKKIFYLRRSNRIDVAPHSVQLANNCRDGTNETTEHFKTLQQLWNE